MLNPVTLKQLRSMSSSIDFEMCPEQAGRLQANILAIAQLVSASSRNPRPDRVPTRDTSVRTNP
jgi:hypothetical protein